MDEKLKLPLLILAWFTVFFVVVVGVLFIYGVYLGFTDPSFLGVT